MPMSLSLSTWVSDPDLLREALTHSSYVAEHPGRPFNERLEFLGDAVVGLVIAELLYRRHPDWDEGRLTRARARLVSQPGLAEAARRIHLGDHLRLGRGEQSTGGRHKPSLLADAMEAVAGAAFLSGGLSAATDLLITALGELVDSPETRAARRDPKSQLIERLAVTGEEAVYKVLSASGPDHEKSFTVKVSAGPALAAEGRGRSKKAAEQEAAAALLEALGPETG